MAISLPAAMVCLYIQVALKKTFTHPHLFLSRPCIRSDQSVALLSRSRILDLVRIDLYLKQQIGVPLVQFMSPQIHWYAV